MKNVKLTIEYDGTNYHGWQSQINSNTIQGVVKSAIDALTGEDCKLIGASRTDSGVHAFGQVANFFTNSCIPSDRFSYALNRILPKDVVIKNSEQVDAGLNARICSKGKKYRYLIYNSKFPSAIYKDKSCHISKSLNINDMEKAMQHFLGTHDFSSFKATGSSVKTSVRTIKSVELYKQDDFIKFEVEGDGFLYNMVRIMVGTLIEVGMGKIHHNEISCIIRGLDRKKAGKTAPAQGLYLVEVYY